MYLSTTCFTGGLDTDQNLPPRISFNLTPRLDPASSHCSKWPKNPEICSRALQRKPETFAAIWWTLGDGCVWRRSDPLPALSACARLPRREHTSSICEEGPVGILVPLVTDEDRLWQVVTWPRPHNQEGTKPDLSSPRAVLSILPHGLMVYNIQAKQNRKIPGVGNYEPDFRPP